MPTIRSDAREKIRPFYLPGAKGLTLAIYYAPTDLRNPLGDILLVPPFAEEMNRCRAMVAMQARAFSRIGIGTLVLDPFGTGDSAGDFSEGSWALWRDDLARGIDWLRRSANGCETLWGIRLGAMMAAELAMLDPQIRRLVLWQPVVDGRRYFTQFLRIRIAAEMAQRDGIKTTDELRSRAAAGESIEVSGYRIGSDLARELDEARFPAPVDVSSIRFCWLDVIPTPEASNGNAKVIEGYKAAGVDVDFRAVVGPAFWQLHERTLVPQLIDATTEAVSNFDCAERSSTGRANKPCATATDDIEPARGAEYPVVSACENESVLAILHRGNPDQQRGVVIVVAGGPQYRAGAHRQFVTLGRRLASRGYPVLRFDLRGMGDSSGTTLGYRHSEADIRSAIDTLLREQPQVSEVVLFGECESASGILFYAYQDDRVKGIVLVNPWVYTEEGRAKVIVKHWYIKRLLSRAFWQKVRSGTFDARASLGSMANVFRAYLRGRRILALSKAATRNEDISGLPLPERTAAGLRRFRGPAMILMSGQDFIAREFDEVTASSKAWQGLLDDPRVCRRVLADADHTFSREVWKTQVADWIAEWLGTWAAELAPGAVADGHEAAMLSLRTHGS